MECHRNSSVNGLTRTVSTDLDSNGTADSIVTHALVVNADTSRTETTSETANNGALLGRTVFTTSANGRTQTAVSALDEDAETHKTARGKYERRSNRYGWRVHAMATPVARKSGKAYHPLKQAGAR